MATSWKPVLIALTLGLTLDGAAAGLLEADAISTGDRLSTIDTATKLEWLDLSATVGESASAVLSGAFVQTHGFRFATRQEVETLWRNAGASGPFDYDPNVESYAGNFAAANLLIALMGCTSSVLGVACDGVDQDWQIGRYAMQSSPFVEGLAIVDAFGAPDYRAGTGAMLIDWGSLDPGFSRRADVGNYLVRSSAPVPEPSTWALAVLGVAALSAVRASRKGMPVC